MTTGLSASGLPEADSRPDLASDIIAWYVFPLRSSNSSFSGPVALLPMWFAASPRQAIICTSDLSADQMSRNRVPRARMLYPASDTTPLGGV